MITNLEYIKGKIADLEDDLQHYTMVDKDKAKEYFIKGELANLHNVGKELKALEIICSLIDIRVIAIKSDGKEFYVLFLGGMEYEYIPKAAYDILKEVLKNE